MRPVRKERKNVTKKYLEFLNFLKNEINNKQINSLSEIMTEKKVSRNWGTFLRQNNIIFKSESGFYYWNEKIPVSIKIVNKFKHQKQILNKKLIQKNQTTIVFNEKEIKKSVDKFKPIKTEQKVGVIRKFLKWLW